MASMFDSATAFNQPIGGWNTSAVTTMASMFYEAQAFHQPIGGWNTSAVTTMADMFHSATAFNQDLCAWSCPVNRGFDMFDSTACPHPPLACLRSPDTGGIIAMCHACSPKG
jgi:surface protein